MIQHDGRLPAAYFAPPIFVKKAFKKMKTFFFRKTLSSSYFLIFPTFKVFWVFSKKPHDYGGNDNFKK